MSQPNINKGQQFASFVLSVIKQKCVSQKKPFFTESTYLANEKRYFDEKRYPDNKHQRFYSPSAFRFDGYAPKGFDHFDRPVIVEVKYNLRNYIFRPLDESREVVSLYIISTSEKEAYKKIRDENIYVWGAETIAAWEKQFPIDYYSFYPENLDKLEQVDELLDFTLKNETNKESLLQKVMEGDISIALGAGVSIEYGAKKWDDLINDFYDEIQRAGKIDDVKAVQKKIGGTSVINGQFAQDNLLDFMDSLYKGLYCGYKKSPHFYSKTTLSYIAELALKLRYSRRFNVITYNYDNFLEQILTHKGIEYNSIYNEDGKIDDKLSVFHPHGFLPYDIKKAEYSNYKNFIVFSESEYHKLYNNPLSWAMVLQQYLYRKNAYLFVGCSLTDPNLRRILENTRTKGKTHYALMLTDGLTKKDQFIVHRHFMRIDVECIWFDTIDDMKAELENISR